MIQNSNDVPAIGKMNAIFNLLQTEPEGLSQASICSRLNLSKATVFRIMNTLAGMGYLDHEPRTGLYTLGARLLSLGRVVEKRLDLSRSATPYVRELSDSLDEMVKLSILRGDTVYPLITMESRKPMRITLDSGSVFAPYVGAAGKLLLAMSPQGQKYIKEILPSIQMVKYTENTIANPEELKERLQIIKKTGIAFDNEEESLGIYAIAAPVYNSECQVIAALSIPFFGEYKAKQEKYMPLLKECAKKISTSFGYTEELY